MRGLSWLGLTDRLEQVLDAEPDLFRHALPGNEAPTLLFCLPDEEDAAIEVARILLTRGAEVTVRNPQGRTAADVARARGLDEAADLMEAGDA